MTVVIVLTFMLVAELPAHHNSIPGVPVPSITNSPPHSIAAHLHPPLCPLPPSSQTNVTLRARWIQKISSLFYLCQIAYNEEIQENVSKNEEKQTTRYTQNRRYSKSTPHNILATVFPWQRTPATQDTLHVVVLECLQSIRRDSFPQQQKEVRFIPGEECSPKYALVKGRASAQQGTDNNWP